MSVVRLSKRGFEIAINQGPADFARETLAYINGMTLPLRYYRMRHRLLRRRAPAGYTTADPFKVIPVDPSEVYVFDPPPVEATLSDQRVSFDSLGRFHKWENVGYVVDGDWDRHIVPLEERFGEFERSARRHFIDGVPWEKTEYYDHRMQLIDEGGVWRGCETKSEVLDRLGEWDRTYHSIDEDGYRRSPPRGIFRWQDHFHELVVCIGRSGQVIRSSSGLHRLCLSRILGLDSVPARVLIRHADWEAIRRRADETTVPPQIAEQADHPDLNGS